MAVEQARISYPSLFHDLGVDLGESSLLHCGRELVSEFMNLTPDAQLLEVGVGSGLSIPLLPENIRIDTS